MTQTAPSIPPSTTAAEHARSAASGDTVRHFSGERPLRIVLYSHDTQGLGHVRRNLLLARSLLSLTPRPNIILIAGTYQLGAHSIPAGIDCVTLPALQKTGDGTYHPRSLSISLQCIVDLRAGIIATALGSFDPDLLIVDKVPLGAFGELEPALRLLRERGRARCVLGLREILDEPEVARREWAEAGNDDAIGAYYDQVWVYGDPAVFDPAREYGFSPRVTAKITYTGYLDRGAFVATDSRAAAALYERLELAPSARLALCCVGGGQDGAALARAFARAAMPSGTVGVILTGPFMPAADQVRLRSLVARRPDLRLAAFVEEPAPLMRNAEAVVAMAGYNTACEILSLARRALLVPRVAPRREQLIRAERFRDLGLAAMIHPSRLSARAIEDWLAGPATAIRARSTVDLGALKRLPELARALTSSDHSSKELARAS
jgi:predicted glycosyltransferase